MNEEDLKAQAIDYIRVHQYPKKGHPAMRATDFTAYINEGCDCKICGGMKSPLVDVGKADLRSKMNDVLPISESCGIKWLKQLGCEFKNHCKGIYFDGHDTPEVMDYAGRSLGSKGFLQRETIRSFCFPLCFSTK